MNVRSQPYKGQRKRAGEAEETVDKSLSYRNKCCVLGTRHHPVWLEDAEQQGSGVG